jgi:hypothetical protein
MPSFKKKVRVVLEQEIEIELTEKVFHGQSTQEYLEEFRGAFWSVDGIDDVIEYAARCVALGLEDCSQDGIGLIGKYDSNHPREPDTKFNIIDEEVTSEIINT